jgi:GNAT superfamily N-acetyltransferase
MSLAIRHRSDPLPVVEARVAIDVWEERAAEAMAALQGRSVAEMKSRLAAGHRPYVATRDGMPAAFGWVATQSAGIGELGFTFDIAAEERYLWNFVTLPAHRGLGIYPALLDGIVRAEAAAERFWIAYAPENAASAAGILKAGFAVVADLSFDGTGRPAVRSRVPGGGNAAAEFLRIPHTEETLAPCWRCVRAGHSREASCRSGACRCDYQRAHLACNGSVGNRE